MRIVLMFVLFCLLPLTAVFADNPQPDALPISTSLQNDFTVTLKASDVASVSFYAVNLRKAGYLNQQYAIADVRRFMNLVRQRLVQVVKAYPSVNGYALFFSGVKFSNADLRALQATLSSIPVANGHLNEKILQFGFSDNSVTDRNVDALVAVVQSLPNLVYMDVANNANFSDLTPLILSLDGLRHFKGLNTRLTHLSGKATFYLFRSILQGHWNGVALSINDIFEANALKALLKNYQIEHLGLSFHDAVGRASIDQVLKVLAADQQLHALHLQFEPNYVLSKQELSWLSQILTKNATHFHLLTIQAQGVDHDGVSIVLTALSSLKGLYGLGLSTNFIQPGLKTVFVNNPNLAAFEPIGEVSYAALMAVLPSSAQKQLCVDTNKVSPASAQAALLSQMSANLVCSTGSNLAHYDTWQVSK